MRDPNFKQDLPKFFRKIGFGFIGLGIAGCLLPLVGLQLAELADIPLGVWTGVPFIVLGAICLGLSALANRNPRFVKRLALVVGVGFVAIIAGGFALGMWAKGTMVPDAERLAEAERSTFGASSASRGPTHARPSGFADDRRHDRTGRYTRADARPDPPNTWKVTIDGVIDDDALASMREEVKALLPELESTTRVRGRGTARTMWAGPINDVGAFRRVLARYGSVTLDEENKVATLDTSGG